MANKVEAGSEEHYYNVLASYTRRLTKGHDDEEYLDLLHDAYLLAAERHPQRLKEQPFFTRHYLTIVIKGEMNEQREKRIRRGKYLGASLDHPYGEVAEGDTYGNIVPARHDTEREALANIELQEILDRAEWDEETRMLVLYSLEENYAGLREEYSINQNNLKSRIKFARRRIKAGWTKPPIYKTEWHKA